MICSICGCEDMMDFGHTALCLKCGKQISLKDTVLSGYLSSAYLFLYEGEFVKADQYCEQALFENPNEAYAYLCKLLAKLHLRKAEDLTSYTRNFKDESYFLRAYSSADNVGDEELKARLLQYHSGMEQNAAKVRYERAKSIMDRASTEQDWNDAVHWFEAVLKYDPQYPNASMYLEQCRSVAARMDWIREIYDKACSLMLERDPEKQQEALAIFEEIHGHVPQFENSVQLEEECRSAVEQKLAAKRQYDDAVALMHIDASIEELEQAIALFSALSEQEGGYLDAEERIQQCLDRRKEWEAQRAEQERREQIKKQFDLAVILIEEEYEDLQALNRAFELLTQVAAAYPGYGVVEERVKQCCARRNALLQKQKEVQMQEIYAEGLALMGENATIEQLTEAFRFFSDLAARMGSNPEIESYVKQCCERRNELLQKQKEDSLLQQGASVNPQLSVNPAMRMMDTQTVKSQSVPLPNPPQEPVMPNLPDASTDKSKKSGGWFPFIKKK